MLKQTLTAAALAAVLAVPAYAQKQPAPDTSKQTQATPDKGIKKDMKSEKTDMKSDSMSNQGQTADKAGVTATDGTQQAGFMHNQEAGEWRASKLIGASVYGQDDKSIGDVNELLIEEDGRVTAVVVGVGGFLGIGEKNVALPLQALNVQRKDGKIEKITVSYTKEQLKGAPAFAYNEGSQAETTGSKASDNASTPMGRDKSDTRMMPDKSGSGMTPDKSDNKADKK